MTISFAGGSDSIIWATPPSTPVNGTVSFKFKTTQATSTVSLLSHWNGSSRQGWGFILNDPGSANKLTVNCANTTATVSAKLTSTTSINDGAWHTAALVYRRNSGNNLLYIDGVQEALAASATSWNPGGTPNMAVSRTNGFWAAYVGEVASIGHWSDNLNADEIAALAKDFSQYGPHLEARYRLGARQWR
jgi:hypothetical protein